MAYTGNIYENLPWLESLGEAKVRELLPTGEFGERGSNLYLLAESWLASKESIRKTEREEEALSIARSADSNAKEALRIAQHNRAIAIIAASAAIVAIIVSIIK